jgi:DNA-directed RNA polymerase specialized sigma24 family protein
MNRIVPNLQADPVLLPFLCAHDDEEAQLLMDQLLKGVTDAIRKITNNGKSPEDAFQETMLKLIKRLWTLRSHHEGATIRAFDHYIKVVASNTVWGQVREDHPSRRAATEALRHVLRTNPSFYVQDLSHNEKLFGLAAWGDHRTALQDTEPSGGLRHFSQQ